MRAAPRITGGLKASRRPSAGAKKLVAGVAADATLRAFVHDLLTPLSAIQFATSAL